MGIFILILILFIICPAIFFYSLILAGVALERGAYFVPAEDNALKEIVGLVELGSGSVFYDLGCGDGRALVAFYKKEPRARYIGIEKHLLPYLLAKIRTRKFKKNITLKIGDIFKEDLSPATHIYTYLSPGLMDKLLPKFERELKHGSILISPSFIFSDKKLSEAAEINAKKSIIKNVYFYKF